MVAANKHTELFQAIKAAANAAAVVVGLPLQFIGDNETPPVLSDRATPYLTCQVFTVKPIRLTLGSTDPSQRKGIIKIILRRPLYEKIDVSIQVSGDIANQFPADSILTFGSSKVSISEEPHVKEGYLDAGMWLTPIDILWEAYA